MPSQGDMKELARKNGARTTDAEINAFYVRGEKPVVHIFRELKTTFSKTLMIFAELPMNHLEDASRQQVRHADFFWNPTGTLAATDLLRRIAERHSFGHERGSDGLRDHKLTHPSIDRRPLHPQVSKW